jgi:tetratricopeptide (TPR) repeat protein
MRLRLLIVLLMILLPLVKLKAQNENKIDSLTRELVKATSPEDKFTLYKELTFLEEPKTKYSNRMLLNAELSGNAELQLKTYLFIGSQQQDSAQFYLDKMFALAKEKKNEEYRGWYYLYSGGIQYFKKNNTAKALDMVREANTIAVTNHLDSLAYNVNGIMGVIHNSKGEKLLEYKSYMTQLSLAEKIGDGQIALDTYWNIFWFYSTLKHYSKAKEYALKILEKGKKENWPPWIEGANHLLTNHYTNVGEFETAKYYYEETNKLRKQNNTPINEDDDLLDIYRMAKDYEKMLRMLQKDEVKKNYQKGNLNSALYDYYGEVATCYTKLGMADSALLSLQKMKEAIRPDEANNWRYFAFLGNYYKLINKADSAAVYYAKADSGIGYTNTIDEHIERYANLDTLFMHNGNYEKAYYYKTLWMQFKDSAAALSEAGDLVVMEIENENQRMEAERRASHTIQYMGITAGLAAVFILLVLLGVFSTSTATIRGLGFFAFIFFFEFLILLFDTAIHALTHGEPWKILSIKIVLIAMLLPLHHYAEHKVVHHLLNRKKFSLLNWRKTKPQVPAPADVDVQ